MRQYIHASATALAFFKRKALCRLKAESKRLKAGSKPNQQQFTQGLPLRPNAVSGSGLVTMTGWEGVTLHFNEVNELNISTQSDAIGSGGLVKRRAGSLARGLKDRFTLIYSGYLFFFKGFQAFAPLRFWCLFHLRKHALAFLSALKKQLTNRKKILALPLAMRRGDDGSQDYSKKSVNAASSQQQFTQGLSPRSNAKSDAGLVTMTPWECGTVLIHGIISINNSSPKSNNLSLTKNSALAVAVEMKNKLHLLCSNWRSGGFFWLLFSAAGKKLLALPPAMRREDYDLQNHFKKRFNSEPSQQQFTRGLSPRSIAMSDAGLVTMTARECGAVQINRSALINKIIPKSNNPSLTPNSALFYAVVLQKIKHCLYSKKRSGEFFIRCLLFFKGFQVFAVARVWLLFLRKKLRSTLECLTIKLKRNEKTALAILSAIKKQMLDRKIAKHS